LAAALWIAPAPAQEPPAAVTLDSSLRAGYLFGRQLWELKAPRSANFYQARSEFNPRLPMLSAVLEFSPYMRLSGRAAGSTSILESSSTFVHLGADWVPSAWDSRPAFNYWEAAGLFHLSGGDGYRFSLVGGYRQETWTYSGGPLGINDATVINSDWRFMERFNTVMPFIALQTAVFHPWWKARFEALGSPRVGREVSTRFESAADSVELRGWAESGGVLEFDVEGTVFISNRLRLGVFGRYTYRELRGDITRTARDGETRHELLVREDFAALGLNFTYLF
jgi:hypothetical protein